jgi:hypothetical protein
MHQRQVVRLLAPWPVALATGLKYFPVLGGIVLLTPGQSRKENYWRVVIMVGLLAMLAWSLRDDVHNYLDVSWVALGQFTFGAASMPRNYGLDVSGWLWGGRLLGALLVGWAIMKAGQDSSTETGHFRAERLYALLGAAVLAGNFFLTIGFLYKVIFAVWLLPQCLRLSNSTGDYATVARWVLVGLIAMVWVEGLMCVSSTQWLLWMGSEAWVFVRRTTTSLAGLIAWTTMIAVVFILGCNLRYFWRLRGNEMSP